jgi:2-oxoglutarate/2-oxoacid ferredoxin oxidoreductase subunit beta
MKALNPRPETLFDSITTYCPGCSHGITQRLVAEVIDELGVREKSVLVLGIGCYNMALLNFNLDMSHALHGRAPAVATGIKRMLPGNVVFTMQGDGDLAAIGLAEIVHAAGRGERFTTIFLNNANYGMTGGQMAPTTLVGQKTTTSKAGRDAMSSGYPMRMAEIIGLQPGAAYVARVSTHSPAQVARARKAIRKAFQTQLAGTGFSFVEVLSACPSGWRKTPLEALAWIKTEMVPVFPLGEFHTARGDEAKEQ